VLIAAVADNGVIGADGTIPWHLPDDFAHFRRTTLGHALIMGRATYDSIGRALPGRTTIVLTRDRSWSAEGVLVAHDLDEALALAAERDLTAYVAGGAAIYALALPVADEQVLSEVHLRPEGDTRYPDFDRAQWRESARESYDGFDVVHLVRLHD